MKTTTRILFIAVLALGAFAPVYSETKPRNIIFILIDDQRFDALSMMGFPFLETPRIDALAEGGIFFENAFVTTSLCSPSRASFLSGQYAHTHGVLDNSTRLPASTPTFPKELQKAGYETAFVGKWHMGGSSDEPRPGFDRWVSFRGQGQYYDCTFNIDGEQKKMEGYTTDIITDYAVDFIKKKHDKPFFLYMSHKAVHGDFYPAKRHEGVYDGKHYPHPDTMANTEENYRGKPEWVKDQRQSWHGVDGMYNKRIDFDEFTRDYCETMLAVDDSIGRVVDTLKETGELDSTLILYTSDNGFQFGEHGLIDKRTMYEPSIRIPLIAHCPDLFEGGQRKKEMILNIDFAPTFLEAAGAEIPGTVQGDSFYKLMTGEPIDWRKEFLYEYYWERSFAQTPTVLGVRTDKYKLMRFHGIWDKYELYDIENDPDEKTNLLGDFIIENQAGTLDNLIRNTAEPELKNLFVDLSDRLDKLLEETGSAKEPNWRPVD
ncbi:MAG: sulfatase [Candidatus Omnitrophica bacterium]|nr:sulfatase [Candidatus Omnitrophota bacterium]MCA9425007.1 sulfatase [Candidatus Omnitrophota bacterium]MCB9783083.1 sulfatase [Candidatus Omnitrophota bacterium]